MHVFASSFRQSSGSGSFGPLSLTKIINEINKARGISLAVKWYDFGVNLIRDEHIEQLDVIDKDHYGTERKLYEVLKFWQNTGTTTFNIPHLIRAIEKTELISLGSELREVYRANPGRFYEQRDQSASSISQAGPRPDLAVLSSELNCIASDAIELGTQLISSGELNAIERDYPRDCEKQLREILAKWLDKGPDCSYDHLVMSLRQISHDNLAGKLELKYCQGSFSQASSSQASSSSESDVEVEADERSVSQAEYQQLHKEFTTYKAKNDAQVQRLLQENEALREQNQLLVGLKSEKKQLQGQVQRLQGDIRRLEAAKQRLEAENQRLETENQQLRSRPASTGSLRRSPSGDDEASAAKRTAVDASSTGTKPLPRSITGSSKYRNKKTPDLSDLMVLFTPLATDWKEIGLALGLNIAVLENIEADNPSKSRDCMRITFQRWLQLYPRTSFATLIEAVNTVFNNKGKTEQDVIDIWRRLDR